MRFSTPVRFLARKAQLKAYRNIHTNTVPVVISGYGSRTACKGYTHMVRSNKSQDSTRTLCDARTGVVRVPHGNIQCFHNLRAPYLCGTHKVCTPLRSRKIFDTTKICSLYGPGSVMWLEQYITLPGPVWAIPGLLKGYFEQKTYVPAQDPYGTVRILSSHTGPVEF